MPSTNYSSLKCDGDSPNVGYQQVPIVEFVTIQAVAGANTDGTFNVPYGARIIDVKGLNSVAFTGATATIQLGTSSGGTQIAAATDVKAANDYRVPLALNASVPLTTNGSQAGGTPLFWRLVQTTPTAVGTAQLAITFVMP